MDNAVQHILVHQHKKHPIKKSELLKTMNISSQDYKETILEVAETLDNIFGMQLIGLKKGNGNAWTQCQVEGAGQLMIVSKYAGIGPISDNSTEKDVLKEFAIKLILNTMYIAHRDVDEEYLWQVLLKSDIENVCERKDNFGKFLKTELVDTMYATRTEIKSQDEINFRYSLGIRAHLECDKYEMLKHIAQVLEKPMPSFKKQYAELQCDEAYAEKIKKAKELSTPADNDEDREGQDEINLSGLSEEIEDLQEIAIVEVDVENEEESEEEEAKPKYTTRTTRSRSGRNRK